MLDAKSFDTHGDDNAGNGLRDYLNSILGKYVTFDYVWYLYCFEHLVAFLQYRLWLHAYADERTDGRTDAQSWLHFISSSKTANILVKNNTGKYLTSDYLGYLYCFELVLTSNVESEPHVKFEILRQDKL